MPGAHSLSVFSVEKSHLGSESTIWLILGAIVADLDLLIAATAVHHQWTVATLNSRGFSRIEGIAWEEWSAVS